MREQKSTPRQASSDGGSLVAVLILLAVVGAGFFGLTRHKEAMKREAQAYANRAAEQLLFAHDPTYLAKNFSGAAQLDYPPSWQETFIGRLNEAGPPTRPIIFEGDVRFRSYFFNPSAELRAPLHFYRGPGTFYLNISHPGDRWQIDGISLSWNFSGAPYHD